MCQCKGLEAKVGGKKSLAFSVAVKGIKSLIVDFTNKSLKEGRRIRKIHQERHMMWTITKEKRGRRQIQHLESSSRRFLTGRTQCAAEIKITDTAIVNALLDVQDSVMQTWIIESSASFHCTLSKECFLSFSAGNFGKFYLGTNHACNIEGRGVVQVAMANGQELTQDPVRFVPGIKKSLLSVTS